MLKGINKSKVSVVEKNTKMLSRVILLLKMDDGLKSNDHTPVLIKPINNFLYYDIL